MGRIATFDTQTPADLINFGIVPLTFAADALRALGGEYEIVVNLQGDAPLTPPHYVEALIEVMAAEPEIAMATPVLRTGADHLAALQADRKAGRVGATTAVFGVACSGEHEPMVINLIAVRQHQTPAIFKDTARLALI